MLRYAAVLCAEARAVVAEVILCAAAAHFEAAALGQRATDGRRGPALHKPLVAIQGMVVRLEELEYLPLSEASQYRRASACPPRAG